MTDWRSTPLKAMPRKVSLNEALNEENERHKNDGLVGAEIVKATSQ
jgi:hypothetical protein